MPHPARFPHLRPKPAKQAARNAATPAVCLLIVLGMLSLRFVNVEEGISAAKDDEDLFFKSL